MAAVWAEDWRDELPCLGLGDPGLHLKAAEAGQLEGVQPAQSAQPTGPQLTMPGSRVTPLRHSTSGKLPDI